MDPNHMDATLVLSMCNWVMGELVRVLHNLPVEQARAVVDALAERRVPLVWVGPEGKRILEPSLTLKNQVLVFLASEAAPVRVDDLFRWYGRGLRGGFNRALAELDGDAQIAIHSNNTAEILPPGAVLVERVLQQHMAESGKTKPKAKKAKKTGRRR